MNYSRMFDSMFPGFFNDAGIKDLPEGSVYAELVMDLRKATPHPVPYPYTGDIAFGIYQGEPEKLKEAVGRVDEEWIRYFGGKNRAFCAFENETIASFCILEDWGRQEGLRVGGPGCVGTVPEYRKRGIGLEMVSRASNLLSEERFDLSWVHYTHLRHWYEKLGYQTVLRWDRSGIFSA